MRREETSSRRPIVTFVVVAYALSWVWWLPLALGGHVVVTGASPTHLPGLLGPMLAALLVASAVDGRLGLVTLARSMVSWRMVAHGGRWCSARSRLQSRPTP
ncbi:hypothetical protein ACGFNU_47460 [Spirillospora sp. NPDC048911]|uniref:hypothetical protein n=1 Tax=Spirillospora sp. NPDC048911 TaxID=3364527 RepID=UPI00371F7FAB